jgi:predicted ArsR family transcriptional regulator
MRTTATGLHPTAFKILQTVHATEQRALNYREWIAEEAGVSESTVSRWLNRMDAEGLVKSYEQDWIWGDPHKYWRLTISGENALDEGF